MGIGSLTKMLVGMVWRSDFTRNRCRQFVVVASMAVAIGPQPAKGDHPVVAVTWRAPRKCIATLLQWLWCRQHTSSNGLCATLLLGNAS